MLYIEVTASSSLKCKHVCVSWIMNSILYVYWNKCNGYDGYKVDTTICNIYLNLKRFG